MFATQDHNKVGWIQLHEASIDDEDIVALGEADVVAILKVLRASDIVDVLEQAFAGRGYGHGLIEQLDLESEAVDYARQSYELVDKEDASNVLIGDPDTAATIRRFIDSRYEEFEAFCRAGSIPSQALEARAWIQGV